MKIGLFYGTDTGNTERVAKIIKEKLEATLGPDRIELHEIYHKKKEDMESFDFLILGMPTWYDGELQGDWEEYIPELQQIDFSGKKIAFFGLGDQYGYASYFCDALGVFSEIVEKNKGTVVGLWPIAGYEHDYSKAQRGDQFIGLCIDDDNQSDQTEERIQGWVQLILPELT
ncbi:MAG: flavodoxin [Bacteroidetes bacterium]|nr:flavodoxin [Bacteroidota bacterium]